MKHIIKKSLLISGIVNLLGIAINLLTYFVMKKMFLCITYSGDEWVGYDGFGIMMNKTFPMSASPNQVIQGETWLSFEPISLLVTYILFFVIVFTVLLVLRKRK